MINTKRFLFLLLLLITSLAYSQSSCPNVDFETGTLNGWSGQTGNCCPIFTSPSGIVNGRHTIMSGTGTDPNTCDMVTVVAPGGLYSARVGNNQSGSEAETLSYTITVTPASTLFIYKYAVVLQDPGHDPSEQPRFQVRVLDAMGMLVDPTCGQYTVVAGVGLAGFQTCSSIGGDDVRYRDWTTVGLNLSSFLGQTLTIEFETGDCLPGAHFGYAYVDAYCSPLQIGATYCSGSFAAELTAPIGFSYLWNTGETTRTILVTSPTAGLNYSCTLTSVTGCTVVISTVLQLEDPTADFTITNTCFNNAVFDDTTVLSNVSLLDSYLWDFGDGTTSNLQNPTHSFPGTGTYIVKFITFNAFGCTTTSTQSVTVFNAPTAQITYGQPNFCSSDSALKLIQLTGTDLYTGGTYSVDVPGLSFNTSTAEFTPNTSTPGTYIVTYTIPTSNGCTVPSVSTTVTIIQSPLANIAYSALSICNQGWQQYVTLTGVGSISGGSYSATPPGLSIDSVDGTISPNLSLGGNYVITYITPPIGGVCSGIRATTNITIIAAATAQLVYATPFCNSVTTPQMVTLTGTGNFGTGVFRSLTSGLQINTTTGEIVPSLSTPGSYTIEYRIPAFGGCSSVSVNTDILITPLPTASISYADPFCRSIFSPEIVTLSGTGSYTGGLFTAPAGLSINGATGEIKPNLSEAGTYQVVYIIPARLGCRSVQVNTSVTILPLPEPALSNFTICEDPRGFVFRPATLDTGLSDSQYACQWFLNDVIIPGIASNQYTTSVAGNYSVLVTNITTGCFAPLATSTISTAITVEDFITYVTDTFEENNTVTVIVNGGTGPYLFKVDDLPFQEFNVFGGLSSGIHEVTITDVNNCTEVTKKVMVLGYPNYFTPNDDGYNDFWNIYYYDDLPNAKTFIYDRFGKLIKQLSPQGLGWDGTFNGTKLPSTDYWFLVEYKDFNEKGELEWGIFKSHFSLKR